MGNAKIVCKIEPDLWKKERMEQFILGGMDVVRCVYAPRETESCVRCIREVGTFRSKRNQPIEILFDIQKEKKDTGGFAEEILLGISQKVKMISVPFVNMPKQGKKLRKLLDENGGKQILLIMRMEEDRTEQELEKVLDETDGIMIGKAVTPEVQRLMMKKAYEAQKMLVTATLMLDFRVEAVQNEK